MKQTTKDRLSTAALLILFFLVYGIVGTMDYEDALDREQMRSQPSGTVTA